MFFNRLLPNSRHLMARKGLLINKTIDGVRNKHVCAIPPRNNMSFVEKVTVATLLSFSMFAIPGWVIYFIPEYQSEDRNTYTGR